MDRLAQELIDAIVDEVAATNHWCEPPNRKDLEACALVGRTFLVPSQRQLFQSLKLKVECRVFGQLAVGLSAAPHLGSYIRDLHVDHGLCWCKCCDDFKLNRGPFAALEIDPFALATIVTLLSRVRRLVISSSKWGDADESHNALNSIMCLPSLRCIGFIYGRDVPVSLVAQALAGYEEVALVDCDLDHTHTTCTFLPKDGAYCTARPLTRLALALRPSATGGIGDLMSDDLAGSWQHLQQLHVLVRKDGSLNGLEKLALTCSDSLQHLRIHLDAYHDNPVDLPHIPALRFLTLQAKVRKLRVPHSVMTMMATLPEHMPNVEVVHVVVDAEFEDYPDTSHRPLTDSALKRLARLREVHFDISVMKETLGFDVNKKLPMASEAGLLSVSRGSWERIYHPMRYFSN
ncbi:hypothetical protein DFH06DRAFT_1481689 [Mycena polygramma]|nr:hypothetical protein DFH06DRAFT_1481689 [Mycena polygramma]